MSPNGSKYVLRVVLFTVCAGFLFPGLAGAETVRGIFKLSVPAHWGAMVLAPGEYEFVVDTGSINRLVTVRSQKTGWSGMILATSIDSPGESSGLELKLANYDGAMWVEKLYLNDAGMALEFTLPKPSMTKLAHSPPMATSASGTN